jgi:hypothetical protein
MQKTLIMATAAYNLAEITRMLEIPSLMMK